MKGEAKRKIERQLPGFTATHVAIAYSVGGESFEVVHSLPGETRDLRASFEEEGVRSGRACASVPVTLVWRSPAGRLARRVHLLPGGAHDVEVRYTYLEAPSDALGGRRAQEWDVSAVALPYRGPLRAKQAALGEGLRLLDLAPLLML